MYYHLLTITDQIAVKGTNRRASSHFLQQLKMKLEHGRPFSRSALDGFLSPGAGDKTPRKDHPYSLLVSRLTQQQNVVLGTSWLQLLG